MNKKNIEALKSYLLKPQSVDFWPIKTAFSEVYINSDLIYLMETILKQLVSEDQRKIALICLKKLVKQIVRSPKAEVDVSRQQDLIIHLSEIKEDQKKHDPIKWIDAELECLRLLNELNQNQIEESNGLINKTFWNFDEAKRVFNCTKSTLYKRISEKMPCYKIGGDIFFFSTEVLDWIKTTGN